MRLTLVPLVLGATAMSVLGLLFVVLVAAASVQDTTSGHVVVEQMACQHPTVAVTWPRSRASPGSATSR
jgi:hypothetical protein